MTPTGELQRVEEAHLVLPGKAMATLPARQGAWVGAQVVTAALLALTGIWAAQPELALSAAIGVGASSVNPRKLWAVPLGTAAVLLAGAAMMSFQLPAVIGAGAMGGAVATRLLPHKTDWVDTLNGALATLTGASLGLWAATTLMPATTIIGAIVASAIVGLVGSQGLLPAAFRFDQGPDLPTPNQIKTHLKLPYRPPVLRAVDLFDASMKHKPDTDTRRGLAEVATWVYRLQLTRQTLDTECEAIDPISIRERIAAAESLGPDADPFTRERKQATAQHLRRLLDHRGLIETEIQRTEAVVDYALAFLEEARAGLAVAQQLPGEATPTRLNEVLDRLRSHAEEGKARRMSAREIHPAEL